VFSARKVIFLVTAAVAATIALHFIKRRRRLEKFSTCYASGNCMKGTYIFFPFLLCFHRPSKLSRSLFYFFQEQLYLHKTLRKEGDESFAIMSIVGLGRSDS